MDQSRNREEQLSYREENAKRGKRITEVDSDEEAQHMQLIMNCIYTLLFLVIAAIFIFQYWLAQNKQFDEKQDAEDL